ncbi:hypothetical protein BH18THE2_BH18THE2_01030 [soil metagenome]
MIAKAYNLGLISELARILHLFPVLVMVFGGMDSFSTIYSPGASSSIKTQRAGQPSTY